MDIKTVTARQYASQLTGRVSYIIPPIDRDIFNIQERKPNAKPILGVSGFVDQSKRKGEHLLARLAASLDGKAEIVSSGQGWPVRRINDNFEGLPGFYNSLDLYVCTSLIEGIPITPLEALSCGVPVVIPRGVGMLDDLPDIPGIWRYQKGDFDDLLAVVKLRLREKPDREALRATTEYYTLANWIQSHKDAFERGGVITPEVIDNMTTDRHGQRGVYYVAYGDPARECARGAIQSFKRNLPEIPVAMVGDKPLEGGEDFFIYNADEDIGGRLAKVKIYDLAPAEWTYIAYLDADTEIIAPETFLWNIIEAGWDMVICKNPARFHVASQMRRSDNGDECDYTFRQIGSDQVMQLNGGVFAFQRNERTKAFFHAWEAEWRRYGKRDQGALLRALWANPLKLYVLGNEWNNIVRYGECESAWLNHYPLTARRWRGVLHYRSDDPQAWRAVSEFEANKK